MKKSEIDMEALKVLEDKVSSLVKLVEMLRADNDKLMKENEKIKTKKQDS